ncbi:MAG: efflux RND transporter periplasmic adaptor subunit [Calditrichae bacterium]|nr:efflux RND transporter periplasmic adaptor subunit [Calditrichia bacterium]
MRPFGFLIIILSILIQLNCGSNDSKAENHINKDSTKASSDEKKEKGSGKFGKSENQNINATPVEVTPVTRGEISSFLLYNSTLETEEMADVYSRIPGLVEKLFVEEGDRVTKNQPLLQIERDEHLLEEQKAKLDYDKQESEFSRFEALKDKNLISVEEFESARLTLRQTELQWKQAKLNLDYTIVRAPINGLVGERMVRLGDRIQTSTQLFVVSNPKEKVVKLFVPQDELLKCYLDQAATISTDVLPETIFIGWVKRISPIVDPTSGTFKVTSGVKDPQNSLRPGMFVSVKLIVDVHEKAILIPKAALIYENERTYFFVVESDSVVRLELKKGFEDAEKVELLNDVADTSKVVVVGQRGLKDGSKIKVVLEKYYFWQNISKPQENQNLISRKKKQQKSS